MTLGQRAFGELERSSRITITWLLPPAGAIEFTREYRTCSRIRLAEPTGKPVVAVPTSLPHFFRCCTCKEPPFGMKTKGRWSEEGVKALLLLLVERAPVFFSLRYHFLFCRFLFAFCPSPALRVSVV